MSVSGNLLLDAFGLSITIVVVVWVTYSIVMRTFGKKIVKFIEKMPEDKSDEEN